jgi:DNA-directed RNA polymerase subunit L
VSKAPAVDPVAEAARALLDRVSYRVDHPLIEAMQRVLPTEQGPDLYTALIAGLTALAQEARHD